MELGRRPEGPAGFFDDVDRGYVVAQLERAMDEPVELSLAVRRGSPLLLPGGQGAPTSEEARRAERLTQELGALVPALRVTVDEGGDDVPVFTLSSRAASGVRFVGVPRVNIFRLFLEAIRRISTGDHGLPADRATTLAALPAGVHAQVFATPTCPSCPPVVSTAICMALAGERLQVDVVDGIGGMDLVRQWGVTGVPTVILNGRLSVEGPVPEESLLEFVRHAADPSYPPPAISSVPFLSCGRLDVR